VTPAAVFAGVDFHAPVVDAVLDAAVNLLGLEVVSSAASTRARMSSIA
jgi:hypothetical protein